MTGEVLRHEHAPQLVDQGTYKEPSPSTDNIRVPRLEIDNATTYIDKDGSNNITFTDAVTGTKTLAELAAGAAGGDFKADGTVPMTGNIQLGANKIVTTNVQLFEKDATWLNVRNSDDTLDLGLRAKNVEPSGDLIFRTTNSSIRAKEADTGVLLLVARDTGVGNSEVARLQGAADPYMQATLPLVLKPIATASLPATPVEGMITYDATLDKLTYRDSDSWEVVVRHTDYDAHSARHIVGGADTIFPADPGADRYLMWDDDPGALVWGNPAGSGDVTSAAAIVDHTLVRGDGGVKGVQDTAIVVDDSENVSGMGTLSCGTITSHSIVLGTGDNITGDDTDITVTSGAAINLTAVTDVVIPANVGITFGAGEKIEGDSTDLTVTSGGAINLTAVTDVVIPANVGITFGTGEKIEGDSTDLTVTSGAKINLTATTDVILPVSVGLVLGDGAEKIESDNTDLTINSGVDINLTAVGDVNMPANVGITFGDDGEKIEGNGTDLTINGNNINLTAVGDVIIPANVGITFGTGEKIEGDSTDLTITSGAKINLTAISDVIVPVSVGIILGDGAEKIESNNTDLTINSGVDINLTAIGDVNVPANVGVTFGDDGEKIEGDGTNLAINSSGTLTLTSTGALIAGTQGITDNSILSVDQADAADNDYAKFTANGIEGRSYTELKSDIGLDAAAVAAVNAAGIILADTKVIEYDPTPAASHTANGDVVTMTAGIALVFGDACYVGTDGKMEKALADDAAITIPATLLCIATIAENAAGLFLKPGGYAHDDSWAFDVGLSVYLSAATAGLITKTMPTKVTGNQVQVLGTAIAADTIEWNPSMVVMEYA